MAIAVLRRILPPNKAPTSARIMTCRHLRYEALFSHLGHSLINTGVQGGRAGMGVGLDRALWRSVAAYRVLSLAYAAALLVHNRGTYHHPWVAWGVLAGMVGWTVAAIALYPGAGCAATRPPAWLLGLDMVIAV